MSDNLKIFCAIQPFDFMQTIYTVNEDGSPTKVGKVNLDNLPLELYNCCLHYGTKTILLTAEKNNSPVILGVSEGAAKYMCGFKVVADMVKALVEDETNLLQENVRKVSFKEKTANNIIEAIEKSKSVPFARVLFALGIKFVGETTAKLIAKSMGSIDNIINASLEELTDIEEVGGKIALSIKDFFADERNITIINKLKEAGLQFEQEKKKVSENQVLSGMSIVVSGVFSTMSRDEIKQLIEDLGGKNVSSISKKTSFIVAGDKMGPEKRKKAESLGIEIKTEDEFLAMTGNSTTDFETTSGQQGVLEFDF